MTLAQSARARKLILDALHLDHTRLDLASVIRMRAEDWDEFSRLARMHRLGPMLRHRLGNGDLAAAIPQEVRAYLKATHRRHTLRNLKIFRELVTVTRILDAGQIPSIALKGAFLAQFAYAELGLRPMRDLDLLLKPEKAVEAFELLKSHGYQAMFDGSPEAYFEDRKHLPPLTGPGGIGIELHHRLTYPTSHLAFHDDAVEELWGRSRASMVGGIPVRFLCPEDMLLHLCVHATMEHLLNVGPLALADVALLIGTQPVDWKAFLENVSGGNWQRCVLPLLHLARLHLGADMPDEVIRALGGGEEDSAWLCSAEYLLFSDPEDHKLLDYDVQEILYSGKLSERLSKLVSVAFPPRVIVARHHAVSATSAEAYLYYPLRWYRLLTEKLPTLLKAHSGRAGDMRQLARHRSVLNGWLCSQPAKDEAT